VLQGFDRLSGWPSAEGQPDAFRGACSYRDDVAVVKQPVENGSGDDGITEPFMMPSFLMGWSVALVAGA